MVKMFSKIDRFNPVLDGQSTIYVRTWFIPSNGIIRSQHLATVIILHVPFPPLISGQVRSGRIASKVSHSVQRVTASSAAILIYKSWTQQNPWKTVAVWTAMNLLWNYRGPVNTPYLTEVKREKLSTLLVPWMTLWWQFFTIVTLLCMTLYSDLVLGKIFKL